jgi:uncharacterized protein
MSEPQETTPPQPEEPIVRPSTAGVPSIPSTPDDRTMAMLCHLTGAFFTIFVPLIIWLIKKDQSKFVDDQGKEAVNFHITLMIGHLIGGVTICFTFGLLNMLLYVLGAVFGIIGCMAAQKGEVYRYPFAIRLIQ